MDVVKVEVKHVDLLLSKATLTIWTKPPHQDQENTTEQS